jgi:hypothetical protein
MYRNTGPSKRQKDLAREEKKREKAEKKDQRQKEKDGRVVEDGVDPDIAGIVPGPQPLAIDEFAPLPVAPARGGK